MNSKQARWIGGAGLMAVALVPLAAAAASNEGAVHTTYSSEDRVARAARHVARAARETAATIVVDETLISATVRTPAQREAAAIAIEECPEWRPLDSGPDVRAAEPSRVRACTIAVHDDDRHGDGSAAPEQLTTRSVLVFDYPPAEPGAGR